MFTEPKLRKSCSGRLTRFRLLISSAVTRWALPGYLSSGTPRDGSGVLSMLTSRDRRRFERAAARARRPSGRRSLATLAGRLALWAVVVGIALAGLVVGARGFYAYRSAEAPQTPEVALGGKPAAAPEP